MIESDYQRDLKKGLTAQGIWLYKIPDSAMGITKPCDFIGNVRGLHLSAEAKLYKSDLIKYDDRVITPASFKGRDHQLRHLNSMLEMGGLGLVFVGAYQTQHPWQKISIVIRADKMEETMTLQRCREIGFEMEWSIGWTMNIKSPILRQRLFVK